VRLEKRIQLIEHDAGADAHREMVEVEIVDLAIVPREIDDQSFADGVADQAGTRAARRHRNILIRGYANHGARFRRAPRKGDAGRFDLVNRCVGGVKLPRQIIEPDGAPGAAKLFFLSRSHRAYQHQPFILLYNDGDGERRTR
jgi:hypothetical protein